MSLEEFTEELKEEVQRLAGGDSRVEVRLVQKNNVGSVPVLNIVEKGNRASINFYLNALYEEFLKGEKEIAELAQELMEIHDRNHAKCQEMDIYEKFQIPEMARGLLFFRLIHYRKNREMLKGTPHIRVLDMALVYYLLADRDEESIGSIRVDSEMFRLFGWDAICSCFRQASMSFWLCRTVGMASQNKGSAWTGWLSWSTGIACGWRKCCRRMRIMKPCARAGIWRITWPRGSARLPG